MDLSIQSDKSFFSPTANILTSHRVLKAQMLLVTLMMDLFCL